MTLAGNVVSQGDEAMRANIARARFGVDGTGITVGTLSDSYNCLGGASTDVANGELPAGIIVLDDSICPNGSVEGRAMMQLIVSFQWDSPYFSVSGGAGARNDIDIYVVNASRTSIVTGSAAPNIGGDPEEILIFTNPDPFAQDYNIMITNFDGPDPGLLKYVIFNTSIAINEYDTASGTAYGHSNAVGAEAVAAAFFADTPEFGTDPAVVESFSSAGGVPILFDISGDRKSSPEIRFKPEITAPDGTNTTFFGVRIQDNDNFPNFFGTSAAAPHAAAAAALLLEADPSLLPSEVYAALEQTALDMDDPLTTGFDTGFDFATGSGLIQVDAALSAVAASCPGDLNGDGSLDTDDIGIFAGVFGTANCSENCSADQNADNDVDGMDLEGFIRQFAAGCN